jgi:hypothetical protein
MPKRLVPEQVLAQRRARHHPSPPSTQYGRLTGGMDPEMCLSPGRGVDSASTMLAGLAIVPSRLATAAVQPERTGSAATVCWRRDPDG